MSCVTLLSDSGLQDASAAVARGILMQYTGMPVLDISHEVTRFHMPQAAYLLSSAYHRFPTGSIHIPLINLFPAIPHLILSEYNGHYFLAPDNGILTMALGVTPTTWLCAEMSKDDTYSQWLHNAGNAISRLKDQKPRAIEFQPYTLTLTPQMPMPLVNGDEAVCEVIHIDHYENVVTNMTESLFNRLRDGRRFRIQFMLVEDIDIISTGYYDVREGYKLCRFNSNGYLEICINRGKAASLFGLRLGSKLNDIKIIFE